MARNINDGWPFVSEFMTPRPCCIDADQPLGLAAERMTTLRVRHMPVLEGGRLVGVLSERDVALVRSLAAGQLARMTVQEAMTAVPYCVTADAPVAEVARHMALRKLGCALVVDKNGTIEGVFTSTDALQMLAEILEDGMPTPRSSSRLESISVAPR